MKSITAKILFSVGITTMFFLCVMLYSFYTLTHQRLNQVIEEQASMALQFDLAIRKYVGIHIRPVMYDLLGEDEFILETMSTSFVARSVFDEVRKEFPEYIIKFSSDNPRNPINQAGPEELEIIKYFDKNPHLDKWEGQIAIGGRSYMAKFNARRMKPSCLLCHGDPEDAPVSLIEQYGSVAGFHRPIGKVIGMDTVAIPVAKITEKLWQELKAPFIISILGLILFFGAVVLVMEFLVIKRLRRISNYFVNAVEASDFSTIKPIQVTGKDEIQDLVSGFNLLSARLKETYASLDNKVKERTRALEKVNEKLRREIGERKTTEQALRESELRFKTLHNASFGGIAIHDEGLILDCNQGLSMLTGFPIDELIGMNGLNLIAPEFRKAARQIMTDRLETSYEVDGIKKDGSLYNLRIQAKNIPYHGRMVRVTELRDITDSKLAEKEKVNAQKIVGEQKKLALVGQVAGKMAHDFNNILGIVMGNVELCLMQCKDKQLEKRLNLVLDQTLRGRNLTRDLVVFAKSQDPRHTFFKVGETIELVLNLLKKDLFDIEIIREDESDVPDLLADPGMIEHTLVNLIQNSIHALSKTTQPRIWIRTFCYRKFICLEVEDNGCGIPEEHLDDIYEPSFTLKGSRDVYQHYEQGIKGTGYGMANVKKYVQQHNGQIVVASKAGGGTRFSIRFPVIEKKLSQNEREQIHNPTSQAGKRILLVEDETAIADVQKNILTGPPLNHVVDVAQTGQDAMELFTKNEYDFVSLDYILQGKKNGMTVYNHIRKYNLSIPILFISGNIEFIESIKALKRKDALIDHLPKPCQNKDYVSRINILLEKAVQHNNRTDGRTGLA